MASPLDPQAILQRMADALPTHPAGDTSSDLSSSYEVLALAAHACMTALGFRLLGFDEEKRIETEVQALAPRLPGTWNAGFGALSFVYAHKQTSMTDVVNVTRMGTRIEVRALAVGHDVIHRFEVAPRDYVVASRLPLRIALRDDDGGAEDRTRLAEDIGALFVSEGKLAAFIDLFKINVVQKLVPKLQAEGYVESEDDRDAHRAADDEARGQAGREPGRPFRGPAGGAGGDRPYPPLNDPLAQPRRPPVPVGDFPPPDFEDEHEINRPPRGGFAIPGRSPYGIGHDDLNPPGLGPHDPLRPSFVGGGGLPRPGGGGGGMHPTFDDPLFGGQGGRGDGVFDPQAPPGARWDPVGPGAGFPRPGGNPFGGGGSGGGGFGGRGGGFGGGYGGDII